MLLFKFAFFCSCLVNRRTARKLVFFRSVKSILLCFFLTPFILNSNEFHNKCCSVGKQVWVLLVCLDQLKNFKFFVKNRLFFLPLSNFQNLVLYVKVQVNDCLPSLVENLHLHFTVNDFFLKFVFKSICFSTPPVHRENLHVKVDVPQSQKKCNKEANK